MGTKLYVGNLAYDVTSDELAQLFGQYGTVTDATVISDRATGRSRGFGFVEMSSAEEAQKAIEALHGFKHKDRDLVVNEARPPRQRSDFQR